MSPLPDEPSGIHVWIMFHVLYSIMGGTTEFAGNFVPRDECVVSFFDSTVCVGTGRGEDEGRGPCACPLVHRSPTEDKHKAPSTPRVTPCPYGRTRSLDRERGSISYGKYSARGHFAAVGD